MGSHLGNAAHPSGGDGYLLLSLVPLMVEEIMVLEDRRMGVNYGSNRLRFTGPVRAGTPVRGRLTQLTGVRRPDSGVLSTLEFVLEREHETSPALIAKPAHLLLRLTDPEPRGRVPFAPMTTSPGTSQVSNLPN